MATLYEMQKEFDEVTSTLRRAFEEAGDDLDMEKVSAVGGETTEAKIGRIRDLEARAAELKRGIEELKSLKRDADINLPREVAAKAEAPMTLGQKVVASEEFRKALRSRGTATIEVAYDMKATLTTASGWPPETIRTGRIAEGFFAPAPTVLDIIPFGSTSQNSVVYMTESAGTNAAAATAENSAYPEQTLVYVETSVPVRKIGVRLPVTDEVLDDDSRVASIIDSRMLFLLRQRLGDQVLNGTGTAPQLTGFRNVSGINTQSGVTAANILDKLTAAIVDVVDAATYPSAIVLSTSAYETILSKKTTDGLYVFGSPNEPAGRTLWGIPVVLTGQLPATAHAVVGDFAGQSELVFRSGYTVEVGYDGNDFSNGRKTLRADVRAALCVYRPSAFSVLTD